MNLTWLLGLESSIYITGARNTSQISRNVQVFSSHVNHFMCNYQITVGFTGGWFPGGSDGKESACNSGDLGSTPGVCLQFRRPGFDSWYRKISWRRKWQPAPVILPGKSHGWKSLAGYGPWGRKMSDTTERLHFHFPGGTSDKEFAHQCRRPKKYGFDLWVGKITWRREWLSTPVFLPGKSQGQSPQGRKESDTTDTTRMHQITNYSVNRHHHKNRNKQKRIQYNTQTGVKKLD